MFDNQPHQADFEFGSVNGRRVSYHEFDAFRRRLLSATGGLPIQMPGTPGEGTQAEDLWKYLFAYVVLQDAAAAGVRASDLEVGTFLESMHPSIAQPSNHGDRQALERAVDNFCRQMQISRQDLLHGIRELQTIGNYLTDVTNLAAVNDDMVFFFYAIRQSQVVIKRIRIPATEDMKSQASAEIMGRPADQLENEARNYALGRADDRRYRDPSAWRFAYVLTPFVASSSMRQPTDGEISEQYEAGKMTLYGDRPLEEVADAIRSELLRREVERQTLRNLTVDVDPQLRQQGAALPLDELAKLTPLAKYGVTTGETGSEPLSIDDLVGKLPTGSGAELRAILQAIDEEGGQARDAFVDEWKAGFNLSLRPFQADDGYFRLRLLDYRPSAPTAIDGPDGAIRPEIFEIAVADMIADRVDELVAEKAAELENKLRLHTEAKQAGDAGVDPEIDELLASLPFETLSYPRAVGEMYDLVRLPVGDLIGPVPFTDNGANGQELILLVERRIPSREDFEAETPEIRSQLRQMAMSAHWGGQGFVYTMNGPAFQIQLGPVVRGSLMQRIYANRLTINPELLRSVGIEG